MTRAEQSGAEQTASQSQRLTWVLCWHYQNGEQNLLSTDYSWIFRVVIQVYCRVDVAYAILYPRNGFINKPIYLRSSWIHYFRKADFFFLCFTCKIVETQYPTFFYIRSVLLYADDDCWIVYEKKKNGNNK